MPHRTFEAQSDAEALFLEQAQAYFRDMQDHARNASYGQTFNVAEAFAVLQGRELIRKSLQGILQEQVGDLEKKRNRRSAQRAKRKNDTGDTGTKTK